MSGPQFEVDWQVAAHLAIFERLFVDLLGWDAAKRVDGDKALLDYREELTEYLRRKRFSMTPTADELLEWQLHCDQVLGSMFERAEQYRQQLIAAKPPAV